VMRILVSHHPLTLVRSVVAVFLGAGGVLLEGLLLRGLFDVGLSLATVEQRLVALAAVIVAMGSLLLLEVGISQAQRFLGRRVEGNLRATLLGKIPRLADPYFRSRLISDMAERAHSMHLLRFLPQVGLELLESVCQLIFLVIGIIWLAPASLPLVVAASLVLVALPFLGYPLMVEKELFVRTHGARLARFYLDGLRGLVAIRIHAAERSLRIAHEKSLEQWRASSWSSLRFALGLEGLQSCLGLAFVGWLVFDHTSRASDPGTLLLFTYWVLSLPLSSSQIAARLQSYASCRNAATRLLEPLNAAEEESGAGDDTPVAKGAKSAGGMGLEFKSVTVSIAGQNILQNIHLRKIGRAHV
jgi:ABC-type multidrug transport system fused ATPase/permease subunit